MDRFKFANVVSTTCDHANGQCTARQIKESVVDVSVCESDAQEFNARIDAQIAELQALDANAEIQSLLSQKK